MNRREFLFNAAAGLFVAASPKIIFDMGRGAHLRPKQQWTYVIAENLYVRRIDPNEEIQCCFPPICHRVLIGGIEPGLFK